MQKPKIDKIYLDLDGVLCDFDKRYKELYGMNPKEAEKQSRFDHYFEDFMHHQNFATLDLMPGAHELITFLKHLSIPTEILSSTSSRERHHQIAPQKLKWLETHQIPFKPNLVPGAALKQDYATPTSILIDDMERNITQWREAGGIGIWHKDVPTTMAILRMYV